MNFCSHFATILVALFFSCHVNTLGALALDSSCLGLGNNGYLNILATVAANASAVLNDVKTGIGAFTANGYFYPVYGRYVGENNEVIQIANIFGGNATGGGPYLVQSLLAQMQNDSNVINLGLFAAPSGAGPIFAFYFVATVFDDLNVYRWICLNTATGVKSTVGTLLTDTSYIPTFGASDQMYACFSSTSLECRQYNPTSAQWTVLPFPTQPDFFASGIQHVITSSSGVQTSNGPSFLLCVVGNSQSCYIPSLTGQMQSLDENPFFSTKDAVYAQSPDAYDGTLFYFITKGVSDDLFYRQTLRFSNDTKKYQWSPPTKLTGIISTTGFTRNSLQPQKTFLFGSTNLPQSKQFLFSGTTGLDTNVYLQVSPGDANIGFIGPRYRTYVASWLGAVSPEFNGRIARNFRTTQVVAAEGKELYTFYSLVCFFQTHSSAVSSVVAGVGNSNQAASELNAQIVGSSVGVICGFVSVVIVAAGVLNF